MYFLDLSGIIDTETFHDYVSKKLDFPSHYGQNMDAFWDCLLDMKSDSQIRIDGMAELRKNLPDFYQRFIECIDDYQKNYRTMKIEMRDDSPSGEGIIFEK